MTSSKQRLLRTRQEGLPDDQSLQTDPQSPSRPKQISKMDSDTSVELHIAPNNAHAREAFLSEACSVDSETSNAHRHRPLQSDVIHGITTTARDMTLTVVDSVTIVRGGLVGGDVGSGRRRGKGAGDVARGEVAPGGTVHDGQLWCESWLLVYCAEMLT